MPPPPLSIIYRRDLLGAPRIRVLHADHVEMLPDASLDIVVVNSVIQYVAYAEFDRLLSVCRAKLKPQGALCSPTSSRAASGR